MKTIQTIVEEAVHYKGVSRYFKPGYWMKRSRLKDRVFDHADKIDNLADARKAYDARQNKSKSFDRWKGLQQAHDAMSRSGLDTSDVAKKLKHAHNKYSSDFRDYIKKKDKVDSNDRRAWEWRNPVVVSKKFQSKRVKSRNFSRFMKGNHA